MQYILFFFIITIILAVLLLIKFSKKTIKLSKEQKLFFNNNFKKISVSLDKKHQIIDFDKLYHKLLMSIGCKWSFWEILKWKPKEIDNINKIWELHKLRNKLVHDFDLLEEVILNRKAREYKDEFEKLLKRVS